jgi:hypothetical protein
MIPSLSSRPPVPRWVVLAPAARQGALNRLRRLAFTETTHRT